MPHTENFKRYECLDGEAAPDLQTNSLFLRTSFKDSENQKRSPETESSDDDKKRNSSARNIDDQKLDNKLNNKIDPKIDPKIDHKMRAEERRVCVEEDERTTEKMGLTQIQSGREFALELETSAAADASIHVGRELGRELERETDKPVSLTHIGLSIIFWYATSMTITGMNKFLFDSLGFAYPLLVTFIHFTAISLFLQVGFSHCWFCPELPQISKKNYCRFILPIAFFGAAEIALSNLAYTMVSLSVITVIKSSLVVVTYILSIVCGLEQFSGKLLGVVLLIMGSISLSVPGLEIKNNTGVFILCLAVFFASARWVVVHHQLQKQNYSPLQLMVLTQPLSSVFLAGPAVLIDVKSLINSEESSPDTERLLSAIIVICCTVVLAFLVILAEYNLVRVTSSVSLTVAGVGKEIATIMMSIIAFGEHIAPVPAAGITLSILGIVLYSHVRLRQAHTHRHEPLALQEATDCNNDTQGRASATFSSSGEGRQRQDTSQTHDT